MIETYIAERLTLKDYLIAIAYAIEPAQYLNEAICDEALEVWVKLVVTENEQPALVNPKMTLKVRLKVAQGAMTKKMRLMLILI